MLVATNITSGVNCGLLGFKVFYSFFTTANFNIPATFRIGNNMMSCQTACNTFQISGGNSVQ